MGNKYAKGGRIQTDEQYKRPRKWNGSRTEGIRLAKGLTQAQLAEKIGLSQLSIAKFETAPNGESMSIKNVMKVANALELPWIYCANIKQNPIPYEQLKQIEVCWLEERDMETYAVLIDDSDDDDDCIGFVTKTGSVHVHFKSDYGIGWRCWTLPPIESDIAETSWKTE